MTDNWNKASLHKIDSLALVSDITLFLMSAVLCWHRVTQHLAVILMLFYSLIKTWKPTLWWKTKKSSVIFVQLKAVRIAVFSDNSAIC